MVKTLSKPLVLAVLFAVSACSAETTNSAVPSSQPVAAQSAAQATAVTRTLAKKDKAPTDVDYGYTLFGDATLVHPGHNSNTAAEESTNGSTTYGGIDFAFPAGSTVSQLSNLSTDYKFTVGTCSQGSPRFQIYVTNGTATGNIFVYLGPQFPSTQPCAGTTYSNSGNVISPTSLVDATQIGGGYQPWAAIQASYGGYSIVDLSLVVDGFNAPITAQFDNIGVIVGSDNEIYTFEKCGSDNGFTDNDKDDGKCDNDGNGNNNNNDNGNNNNNNGNNNNGNGNK